MIGLLVIAGMLLTLGAGITLWVGGGKGEGSGEMACGACGYAVRGLTQLTCPECGADLREAGINRQSNPGRRRLGQALTFGSVSVFVLLLGMVWLLSGSNSAASSSAASSASPGVMQPAPQLIQPAPAGPTGDPIPIEDEDEELDGESGEAEAASGP